MHSLNANAFAVSQGLDKAANVHTRQAKPGHLHAAQDDQKWQVHGHDKAGSEAADDATLAGLGRAPCALPPGCIAKLVGPESQPGLPGHHALLRQRWR